MSGNSAEEAGSREETQVRIPARSVLLSMVAAMAILAFASIPLGTGAENAAIPNYLTGDSPAKTAYAESLGVSPEDVVFDLEAAMALDRAGVALCASPGEPSVPADYALEVPVECEPPLDAAASVTLGLLSTGVAALGSVILLTSRNKWGLNILVAGVALQTFGIAEMYAERAIVLDPGSLPFGEAVLAVAGMGWVVIGVIVGPRLILTFPTGSPPTPRWRVVMWFAYLAAAILGLMQLLTPVRPYSINPIQVLSLETSIRIFDWGIQLWVVGAAIGSLIGLLVRFGRSTGEERLQLKWVAAAAMAVIAVSLVAEFLESQDLAGQEIYGPIQAFMSFGVLPGAILISIFKYRLYAIDRIISRTLGYALVVGVLGLVYVVGAVWLPTRLVGDQVPAIFVAGSTLLVIVLFNPVRRRLLGWVDRRFYRSRYDALRVAEEFGGRLKDRVDVDGLTVDWVGVVTETMQPRTVGVWVRR